MLASALLAGSSCQKESSEAEVAESVETVFAVQIPSEPMTKYVSKAEKEVEERKESIALVAASLAKYAQELRATL